MGWVTHRRSDEFVRLRNHLEKLHPGLIVKVIYFLWFIVEQIPKFSKKTTKEKFKEESIKKRIYLYEVHHKE